MIYDIGSKDIIGGEYAFGKPPANAQVVRIDIEPGPAEVVIVADAHDLFMVEDGSADCVVTVSTLGHMRYPQKIMKEIYRILRPGGIVYASIPFYFSV
jgi:ubiquinone/menaquinone biosynthesis C-methylase UbiE